jgi:hypothetical protein
MSDHQKSILSTILYFIIVVLVIGSIGAWISLAIEKLFSNEISEQAIKSLPGNILTYAVGIFATAVVDRVIHLFKQTGKYSSNELEFMILLGFVLIAIWIVYLTLYHIINSPTETALSFTWYIGILAAVAWFYTKLRVSKVNNYSPVGGAL